MHKATSRFWSCFYKLPEPTQKLARKNFSLLEENSRHPSLHFKRIGKLWSARVSKNYRALAVEDDADYIWVWIGNHDEYEKLLSKQKT